MTKHIFLTPFASPNLQDVTLLQNNLLLSHMTTSMYGNIFKNSVHPFYTKHEAANLYASQPAIQWTPLKSPAADTQHKSMLFMT